MIPKLMTEVRITGPGGPEVLQPSRVAVPKPQRGELLVKVFAAGVNRPDVLQRLGKYPLPADASPIPGLEIAGEVVALGDQTPASSVGANFSIGDRVCGLTNGGGYAQYCRLPVGQALPWPPEFNAAQAAALPETMFTVWANLFQMGRAQKGETVLVHGGTSGIGTTALMLVRSFGLRSIATAGSAVKCEAARKLGAELAINYREQDFAAAVRTHTAGRGVDIVLDIMGASYFQRNIDSLAKDGRLLLLAFLGGAVVDGVNLSQIMSKRLVVTGSTMRPRTLDEKALIARELKAHVWPRLGAHDIQPIIHATFSLEQAADAHRLMESSTHIGKIVLCVDHEAGPG